MHVLEPGAGLPDPLAPYAAVDRRRADGRPWLLANMVSSLSGTAAVGGRVGALSEGPDAQLFKDLRTLADVVLVGAETVRREGYGVVRLSDERVASRREQGRSAVPPVAVVSRSLDLDWDAKVFSDAQPGSRTLVVTCDAADLNARQRAAEVADVVVAGGERVEPALALEELAALGHRVVLCEGGPRWLGELAAADLVDELCLTMAPVLGGDLLPVSVTPPAGGLTKLRLRHVAAAGDNLFLRYERER